MTAARGKGWPGTRVRGTKRGVLNLKLGHLPVHLASIANLPNLEYGLSASGALSFNFSPYTYPHPLPPPRTPLPTQPGPLDTLRQRGQPLCFPSSRFLLTGPKAPGTATRTHPKPSSDARAEPRSSAAKPARPPHRAPRASTPRSAYRQPRLRALTATEPSRSLEHEAVG